MTLIVVSGAPSTGKSTTAAALGAALRFPVLSLDPIKEALADVLGLGGEDWSNQVGDQPGQLAVGPRGHGLFQPLVEFLGGQPAVPGGHPQQLDHPVPVVV